MAVWLRLASAYGPAEISQDQREITGPSGWLKYLSKHAARGVARYQRRGKPAGWESTGRLWGKGGAWPVVEPVAGVIDDPTYRRLRRLVRSFTVAEARAVALATRPGTADARQAWKRVAWAKRMLRCDDRGLSSVRGVSGWVPASVMVPLALAAGWSGEVAGGGDE